MRQFLLAFISLAILSSCGSDDSGPNRASNSDIVINELQPSNTTTAADPSGQFDDWIELYNTSSSAVDVSGFFLTDNDNNLTRWRIPGGTTISGNGYLIIWADADLNQDGLHADFKLTATGEELILLNSDIEIVDEVEFGEQIGEVSYARQPNGTGSFAWGTPTFNEEN